MFKVHGLIGIDSSRDRYDAPKRLGVASQQAFFFGVVCSASKKKGPELPGCFSLPKTNSNFPPENWCLEYCTCFLLGRFGLFSGAKLLLVSGRVLLFSQPSQICKPPNQCLEDHPSWVVRITPMYFSHGVKGERPFGRGGPATRSLGDKN